MTAVRRHGSSAALALLIVVIAAFYLRWANKDVGWGPDEEQYLNFSRYIALDFFHVLNLGPAWTRGIQRLHVLFMAPGFALFRSPAALQFAHAAQVVGFVMAAIPAWLVARGIGTGRWISLVTAALVLLVPWAIESSRFLTEALGYGVFAWAVWAIWWAIERPGIRRELLAFGVLALAVLTRSGFLPLLGALPAAGLVQSWHYDTGEGSAVQRLRRLPGSFFRQRPLLAIVTVAGVVAVLSDLIVPGGTIRSLAGAYAGHHTIDPGEEFRKWHNAVARVTIGIGFLPFLFGVPWAARELVRPRSPETGAFASAGLFTVAAVLASTAIALSEERYYMYLAIPLVIAGVRAMARGDLSRIGIAAGTALTVATFASANWTVSDESVYRFAQFPAETFYLRVIHTRVSLGLVMAVVVLAGFYAVCVVRLRWRWSLVALLLAPLLVAQIVQTNYALKKFANGPGLAVGLTLPQKAWVDRAVPDRQVVGVWGSVYAADPGSVWREVEIYNASIEPFIDFKPGTGMEYPVYERGYGERVDRNTGLITSRRKLPRYVVTTHNLPVVAPEWRVVTRSDYMPADLMRLSEPLRAQWAVIGGQLGGDGQLGPDGSIIWRFFRPLSGGKVCAGIDVTGPQPADPSKGPKRAAYEVKLDGRPFTRGTVAIGKPRTIDIPLVFDAGNAHRAADVTLTGHGSIDWVGGMPVSVQVAAMRVTPCAS